MHKRAQNRVTSQLKLAKRKFFTNLNPHNSKDFWKTIKTLSKNDISVNKLMHNGMPCNFDPQRANTFNAWFFSALAT